MRAPSRYRPIYQALALLVEDPPLSLGESDLAKQLLPNEKDRRVRGAMLQQALHRAIDSLLPVNMTQAGCHRRNSYNVLIGEYRECRARAELERALGLSRSSYSRAKKRGVKWITDVLPHVLCEVAPPMATVDRLDDLERRVAALEGMRERTVGE